MAKKNSLIKPDVDAHHPADQPEKPTSRRILFEDLTGQPDQLKPARGPLPEEQKPKVYTQQSHSILAPENHDNSAAWKIHIRDTLRAEVARDPDGLLSMILEPQSKQANESDTQPAIPIGTSTCTAMGIEQELELKQIERVILLKRLVSTQIKLLRCESGRLRGQFDATQILLVLCEKKLESLQSDLSSIHASLSEEDPISHTKLAIKIPDPPIFTDGKDPTIARWLFKMRTKFELDRDHYPSESSKLIYAKERVGGKAQQHLEAYLFSSILTTFSTVEDLFAHLEQVFGSPYSKEDAKEIKSRDQDTHIQGLVSGIHQPGLQYQ